jgi:hypothetical protein
MTIVSLSTISQQGRAHQAPTEPVSPPPPNPQITAAVLDLPRPLTLPRWPTGRHHRLAKPTPANPTAPTRPPASPPSMRTTARSSPLPPSRCPPRPPPAVTSAAASWSPSASTLSRPSLPPPPSPPLIPPPCSHPHPSTSPRRGERRAHVGSRLLG